MAITLQSFRESYANLKAGELANVRLNVGDDEKSSVTAEVHGDEMPELERLAPLPDAQQRVADNVYMRSQLLAAIRDCLMTLNVTGRKGGLDNAAAEAFFRQAETRLFGELRKNRKTKGREFGVETASGDLDAKTVKELVDSLDQFTRAQRSKFDTIRSACPKASDLQVRTVAMLTDVELVKAFGLTRQEAAGATFGGFEASFDAKFGSRLKFTVNVPGRSKPLSAQVDSRGELCFAEEYEHFVKVVEDCVVGMGRTLFTQIPENGRASVVRMLELALNGENPKVVYGGNSCKWYLLSTLVNMLPVAYARARQLQKTGDITMSTWWAALGFEGKVPKEKATNAEKGHALLGALYKRTMTDYAAINGLSYKTFAEYLRWYDKIETDVKNLGTPEEKRRVAICSGFSEYLSVDSISYQALLAFLMNSGRKFTATEIRQASLRISQISNNKTDIGSLAAALHNSMRQDFTKYSFRAKLQGDELQYVKKDYGKELSNATVKGDKEVEKAKGEIEKASAMAKRNADVEKVKAEQRAAMEKATEFVNKLVNNHKFSQIQLGMLLYSGNNFEGQLLLHLGGLGIQYKHDIRIEATGDPNWPDMRVTYVMPYIKGTPEAMTVTKQNIVHTVVYTQDGDSWCEELKFVEARANEQRTTLAEWEMA